MKPTLIFPAIFLMFLTANCKKDNSNPQGPDNFSIIYQKSSAWVDYSYTAVINKAGILQVNMTNGLSKVTASSTYQLSESEMLLIKEKLAELTKIDIQAKYGFDAQSSPTDLPITKMIYNTNVKSDSFLIYYPKQNELPIQFDAFMQTIEQILAENDSLINK